MASSSNISIPREQCMKCRVESDILLSARFGEAMGSCSHKFCQSCFRKENDDLASSSTHSFNCPCCFTPYYENIQTIDEAIQVGEAATISVYLSPHISLPEDVEIASDDKHAIAELYIVLIEKLEAAFLLNPTHHFTLYVLFCTYSKGHIFLRCHEVSEISLDYHISKTVEYAYKLLDHPTLSELGYDFFKVTCCDQLARVFSTHLNYPTALKYAELAYEQCIRYSYNNSLSGCKDLYIKYRADFAKLPPLRFAVGNVVEFLHELETGSEGEWKLGRIMELYYRERDFPIRFTAPYRLKLLDDFDSTDTSPVYAWVKADLDRYVRKVGVRSIEDTRYQTKLDAKINELGWVYSSDHFIEDIYRTLAQDHEFVDMLRSVWQIELSMKMLSLYRLCVMYRQPLIRTDSGYHLPSSEEVIDGIRAYFDPAHLSSDVASSTAADEDVYSHELRHMVLRIFSGTPRTGPKDYIDERNVQGLLFEGIRLFNFMLPDAHPSGSTPGQHTGGGSDFTVPPEIATAISTASNKYDLRVIHSNAICDTRLGDLLAAWNAIHTCLDNPDVGPCECPFIYFFVKYCMDQGWGVPKLALALYDRMNMQLSREFIRCANPSCELNKLDRSTGKVKFKKCEKCMSVIYCCKECQTAHYPDHKMLCREHSTG